MQPLGTEAALWVPSQTSRSQGWISALDGHLCAVHKLYSTLGVYAFWGVVTSAFESFMKTVALFPRKIDKPTNFALFEEN